MRKQKKYLLPQIEDARFIGGKISSNNDLYHIIEETNKSFIIKAYTRQYTHLFSVVLYRNYKIQDYTVSIKTRNNFCKKKKKKAVLDARKAIKFIILKKNYEKTHNEAIEYSQNC